MTVQFSKTDFYHRFGLEMHTCRPFYHAISPKTRLIIIARYLKTHWHKVMLRLIM